MFPETQRLYLHDEPTTTPISNLGNANRIWDVCEQMEAGSRPETIEDFRQLLHKVMQRDGNVPFAPGIIFSPQFMDELNLRLAHVLRWVTGDFPAASAHGKPRGEWSWEDAYYEDDYRHTFVMLEYAKRVRRGHRLLGSLLPWDRILWMSVVHDLGEYNDKYRTVRFSPQLSPYSTMLAGQPYWFVPTFDTIWEYRVDPNSEQTDFSPDRKRGIENGAVENFLRSEHLKLDTVEVEWFMRVHQEYEYADERRTLAALFVKFADKVMGARVGLEGPFLREKVSNFSVLNAHIVKSIEKITKYYLLLREELPPVAQPELDRLYRDVLRDFVDCGFGQEVGIHGVGSTLMFVPPSH